MIIGREFVSDDACEGERKHEEVRLEGRNISVGKFGKKLDFRIYKGEILGIFGLVGAGRTELARMIFGIDPMGDGVLYKDGKQIRIRNPRDAIRQGIGMIPEDRKHLGLITKLDVRDNLTLAALKKMPAVLKNRTMETSLTEEYIDRLGIVTAGQQQMIERLSGGNQQKVVISKWLALDLDVVILDEPTRGVDVGAKAEIYGIMRQLAEEGKSILMISSDLPEVLRVSHRILVMHDGEIKLNRPSNELDQEQIMHAAIS